MDRATRPLQARRAHAGVPHLVPVRTRGAWGVSRKPAVSTKPAAPVDPGPAPPAPVHIQRAQADRLLMAWSTPGGWRYWSAVNNQVVGTWYTAAAFLFFLFGGALALLMRVQLALPEND